MNNKKKVRIRRIIQIFFFALIGIISINKTLTESGNGIPFISEASTHALCPFGGVVTLYQLLTLGTFIQKIHVSSVIILSLVLILAVLFGPVFCGWVCPLGSIQEWFGKIGKKIFKRRYNNFVSRKIDGIMRYFRYIVLAWVVYVTAKSGTLIFSNVDPYNALFSFWSDEVTIQSLIVLGVTLTASLLIERPWCKYVCPYGALLGLTNLFRVFKIRRNESTCINCKKCDRRCPMNIEVSNKEKVLNHQCISCFECTSEKNCPVNDTVNLQINRKSVQVTDKETIL